MEGFLILPTEDLVDELKTYEAYFGFYPGGTRGLIQDAFIGRNGIRYWKKEGYDPKEGFDFLSTIDEEFHLKYADAEHNNAYSQQAWESYDVVDAVTKELMRRVLSLMTLAGGNKDLLFFDRTRGYRWLGKSLVVYFGIKP